MIFHHEFASLLIAFIYFSCVFNKTAAKYVDTAYEWTDAPQDVINSLYSCGELEDMGIHKKSGSKCSSNAHQNDLDHILQDYPECIFGTGRPERFSLSEQHVPGCTSRAVSARKGLLKYWKSTAESDNHGSGGTDLINTLLANSKNRDIHIAFVGDSVSAQLYNFLICDLLRANWHSSNVQFTHKALLHASSDFSPPTKAPSERTRVKISSRQFVLQCAHELSNDNCGKKTHELIDMGSHHVYEILENQLVITANCLSKETDSISDSCQSPRSYFIVNYGVHLHISDAKWAVYALARGILMFSKNYTDRATVHYRETSSQAFAETTGNTTRVVAESS
jgi:hypothetical protein